MKRISIFILMVTIIGVLNFKPSVIYADVNAAVTYLQSQPVDDWSAQALVAAGVSDIDETWLNDFTSSNVTAIEKRILTLVALDKDPETYYQNRNLVAELIGLHYQSGQIGDTALLNDDIWGVLALASVGKTQTNAFNGAVEYILANQNSDGGWSYAVGQSSDTNDTATAVMALLSAGYQTSDTVIVNAISYLQQSKNSDHGWGWSAGSVSDSASTVWVMSTLYKAGIAVSLETINFLKSLQTSNGSFKWVSTDTNGLLVMTAYAVIALHNKYFPVKQMSIIPSAGNYLRIEGSNSTICEGYFVAANALEIVQKAADICDFTYEIEQTSFGPYLKKINNDEAQGMLGWLYRVDWLSPPMGAIDFNLTSGQKVLWYFGDWQWPVMQLELDTTQAALGEVVTAEVRAIDSENNWSPVIGATVTSGNLSKQTNDEGKAQLIFNSDGMYEVSAEKINFVRANKQLLTIGNGVGATVGWQVDIQPTSQGSELSIIILNSVVDFGSLKPGQVGLSNLSLQNNGQLSAYVESIVTGEQTLIDNFKLSNVLWSEYSTIINSGQTQEIDARLLVPTNYSQHGKKNGEIIFWATIAP